MSKELATLAKELSLIRDRIHCTDYGDVPKLHDRLLELTEAVGVLVHLIQKDEGRP